MRESSRRSPPCGLVARLIGVMAVAAVAWVAYRVSCDELSLRNLALHENGLRQFQSAHPVLVFWGAFFVYAAITGVSVPGATALTLVFGWYFGFARGLILVSFASTTGATAAFLLSRHLLRDAVQHRFGERLATFSDSLRREGAFYLFTLRLIPAVPFFVVNAVMGLTPVKSSTFWWVSQLGMLPGTAVYVYAGSQFPDLTTMAETGTAGILTPQLVFALVLLGRFPLAARRGVSRFGGAKRSTGSAANGASAGRHESPDEDV